MYEVSGMIRSLDREISQFRRTLCYLSHRVWFHVIFIFSTSFLSLWRWMIVSMYFVLPALCMCMRRGSPDCWIGVPLLLAHKSNTYMMGQQLCMRWISNYVKVGIQASHYIQISILVFQHKGSLLNTLKWIKFIFETNHRYSCFCWSECIVFKVT